VATGNFVIAIITLGRFHSALYYHPTCPENPPALHGRHVDSGMSSILAQTCSIEVWSSKHLGLWCLVGLRHTTTYHMVELDPSGCRSQI
jgi:hypothetical protein